MVDLIIDIWKELQKLMSDEELTFIRKSLRGYSSKAHRSNVIEDIKIFKKISPPPKKILDFGCGIGLQSYLLAKNGYEVYGLETVKDKSLDGFFKGTADKLKRTRDESMKNVWELIKNKVDVRFQFYDGTHIPFDDEYFDAVFSYAVIEHIPPEEVNDIIKEIRRILKRNGFFYIFQLPQRTSYTEFIARKLSMPSHEYLWSYNSIKGLLNNLGFEIIFFERVDMLINHPYQLINPFYTILRVLNKFLLNTPLSKFAHHLTVISKKV